MIITKIIGGLGNQMFQYAIAKAIAIHNNDEFKLDISAYKNYKLHNGYRLNLFNIEENMASIDELHEYRGYNNKLCKILNKIGLYKKDSLYKEKERTIFDKNVFSLQNAYLDGYWQNEKYFIGIRDIILEDFKTKKELTKRAKEYLYKIENTQSISLHVRRGDYLKHPEIGVLSLEYYKNAVNYILTEVKNPIFYVFSNDLQWCLENFSFIENKVFVENTTEIDDITLMTKCKHNIVANSSFSWWGAWLNQNKNKMVIAPKKWMAKNPNNYKWIPKSWVEL